MCKKLMVLATFCFVLSLVLTGAAQGADPSLVAWYRFDGDASDSSGNNLHGTEMGDPTYTAGVFGQAIDLDGDGDYVDCGLDPKFDITEFITFTYWIQVRAFDRDWNTVLSRGDDSWRSSRAGTNNFMEAAVGGTTGNYTYGVTPVDDGQWHHVGWVYDGTMNYLYVDGEVDATEENSGQITVSSYPLYIGDNSQATGRYWNGLIDDVMIFNRGLSQEEIQQIMQSSAGAYPYASSPNPADGALHADTWITLSWKAGDFAVSHDVFLGDNFDDVDTGTGDTFQGNQGDTFYIAGFPGFAFPEGLVPGTTYYWRIDEVNEADPNSPWKGDIWSFSIPPRTAYNPDPADGADSIDLGATLSWTAGFNAKLHTVYFGEDFDTVANATTGIPSGTTTYNPGPLKAAKIYYWRVDEFDAIETYKGDVWSFTTLGAVGNPKPADGAVDITQTPILTWTPAIPAASHEIYLGDNKEAVRNATKASPEFKATQALGDESYEPDKLAWTTTYYWRIDEVNNTNPDSPWAGRIWSFTTADFMIIDEFEDYTNDDTAGEAIWQHWIDGFGVADNGAQVGYLLPPYAEQTIVHGGLQSMPLLYVNEAGVTNSEAALTLSKARDWTEEGVVDLSLWFIGLPGSTGSFTEGPAGTYTMTGSGTDIWDVGTAGDYHDEFHFAYKTLTGAGSITARIDSLQNTNGWAKAGVMIRQTLEGGSKHAFAAITPSNGVASQGRLDTGGASFNYNETGFAAPHWVKLERDMAGNFTVFHSANGTAWQAVTGSTPQNTQMGSNVYIGLALTSHDAVLKCEAVFSNVTTTGNVSGQWANQDIGIVSNAAEPLYVAVSNASGAPAIVGHDDPAAAQIDTWTEWVIPLQAIADQGINLTNVDKIAIGLGSKGGAAAGGTGTVYIDDIRLYHP
ncbi:LamG-like jellyroll fold domain-containing protein [Planctomycetota bacterium]